MNLRRTFVVAVTAAVALVGCGTAGANDASLPTVERDRLPSVEITGLTSGEVIDLSEIDGPAVINLWATWCAPCRAEIPDFQEVHEVRGDEVRFVGINIGEDPDRAAEFIAEIGATYDQFLDLDGRVATELRATSMPVTVVIDADGGITRRHLGPLDRDGLDEAIDEALGLTPDAG